MKLTTELLSEVLQFFRRLEAEDLRTVNRSFDTLSSELRDVHEYKLLLTYLSVSEGEHRGSVAVRIRANGGRELAWEQPETESLTRLHAAITVAFVRNLEITGAALSKRLCEGLLDATSMLKVGNLTFVNGKVLASPRIIWTESHRGSGYIDEMTSEELHTFLLSFQTAHMLRIEGRFRDDDFTPAFVRQCKQKGLCLLRIGHTNFPLKERSQRQLEVALLELLAEL